MRLPPPLHVPIPSSEPPTDASSNAAARKKDLVAVARSILVIAWHLINDPDTEYQDLGSDFHQRLIDPARRTRDLVRQLKALGHDATLAPAS
ncbi:hypothetical protein SGFS_002690 [Streptomyces graminofaciens]|uniref:Transposase n=1 Tax=Streptomyces graminofaciens TaxID=68212 RepID=A0ABM7EZW9_9ACTN|nr:hypothetical protein [Streptomyces graminofaciens]BBC28978.1 hypothetical protein SGFS_002690 [Streptomyces graminofaciens]